MPVVPDVQIVPDVIVPREVPIRPAAPTRADIDQLPTAKTDSQFSAAVEKAASRGVPLIVTFTDTTSGISGEELRLLASAKKQYGDKAEVLLIDRSKLQPGSQLANHFDNHIARTGYPTTMLAKPSEGLRPSDLHQRSVHVTDSRYGADIMMLAKVPDMKFKPRISTPKEMELTDPFSPSNRRTEPIKPVDKPKPIERTERPAERVTPIEQQKPRSFDVNSQSDYNNVLKTAGERKEPVIALYYSSSSQLSQQAVRDFMEARKNVPGATYMAYDVDQLDKMSPQDRQSPIAKYADYVRREVGYPTTMVVPLAPPETSGGSFVPQVNSATFRGGASVNQIRDAIAPAHQVMSRFKFPEQVLPAKPVPTPVPQPERPAPRTTGPRMYA